MFRFENISFLYALLIIPIIWLVVFSVARWKKRALLKFGQLPMVLELIPEISFTKQWVKFIFFSLSVACLVIAAANPQIGTKLEEVKREGIDIMVALDLSNSMLAEDIKPNRLENAKRAISKFIDNLKSDRIGIVIFGGQAYTQLPITTDYGAAKLFLNTINTDLIPTPGTAIGAAINQCLTAFDFETATNKVIIVITDGENHEDDAEGAAAAAAQKGVLVHTIGMGSVQGAPIPMYQGKQLLGFKKDKEGNSIVTKLNEAMLQQISQAGKGVYIRATNSNTGLNILLDEIEKLEKTEFGAQVFSDFEDRFQYFLAAAIVFLVIEFLLREKKNPWLNSKKLFES